MANTYETIIIILALSINTGIILWFIITHYRDMDFGGNPTLLQHIYNKNKMENTTVDGVNVLLHAIH